MPLIDKKKTFCSLEKDDERGDNSSFPHVENYGCFHLSA
jgi:hypothetical protein